jgi:hypothetical protein
MPTNALDAMPPRPPECRPQAEGIWGFGASHVPSAPVPLFDPCGNGPVMASTSSDDSGAAS